MTLKGIFSETPYVCVLTVKYEIYSIILTTFRNGGEGKRYHYPLSTSKRIRKKPTQIRVKEQPITAYSRNKILRDLTGDTTIENNKVIRKQKLILTSDYCKPCFSRTNNLCNQVVLLNAIPLQKRTKYFIKKIVRVATSYTC